MNAPPPAALPPVEWAVSPDLTPYEEAVAAMEARAAAIRAGQARELVWLVEHPPLYTMGTGARADELREPGRLPVFQTGRGGQTTYHGPGQRTAYVMRDLALYGRDVRAHVRALEAWLIGALAAFGVAGETRADRIGVWVARPERGAGREDKIAAIGVRVRKWVSYHGVALNVAPDISHYSGITPCGVTDPLYGVTSLHDLGVKADMAAADAALRDAFTRVFGATLADAPPPL